MPEFAVFCGFVRQTLHLMVGLPDYQRYLDHCRAHHPEERAMTRPEFIRERMSRRYEGKGAARCC
jgi:uncharacterized short protein YbdD (DUF466 family)